MNFSIPLSAPDITEAEIDAVTSVLRTPWLSLGPQLHAFEAEFAAFHDMPHAVGVSSGTAGLHLALITLGIGVGDEVILPSFAFIAVANAVAQVGATAVFADIDPVTLNLDPICVEAAVTPRTRGIIVVHTFGVPAQMDALLDVARRHNLAIVEDACEAIGATFGGQKAGTFGNLAVFGFYPNKQMTTGEGGMVLAREEKHAARLRMLRNQGRAGTDWLDHQENGYNYRLGEMACAMGRVQLSRMKELQERRAAAVERYQELFSDGPWNADRIELPPSKLPGRTISWFVFVVRLRDPGMRESAAAALAEEGIASARYFAPIHLQAAWADHRGSSQNLSVTEAMAGRTLALPLFNRITLEQQQKVAETLAKSVRS